MSPKYPSHRKLAAHPTLSIVWVLLFSLLIAGSQQNTAQSIGQDPYIATHTDPWIPNFGHPAHILGPSVSTTQNGDWENPSTWGGALPSATTTAIIRHSVQFSSQTEVSDLVLDSGAELSFSPIVDTRLIVGTIQVMPQAILRIGTQAQPIAQTATAEIVFKDRPFDSSIDPAQYGNGIIAFGQVEIHGNPVPQTFVRLADEALQGETTVTLESPVTQWHPGDELILPDTRQTDPRPSRGYLSQTERVRITAVSPDNQTFSVTPIAYDHRGARNAQDQLELFPHVGILSRNVILRSENADGVRGHTQFMARSNVDIRYALFKDMGRTTAQALDSTTFDETGTPTHLGTNQVARYPIHTHHLIGPEAPQSNGYQFTLIGNVVDGGTNPRLEKWGITIHGSHDGLIKDNIVVNYTGANIVTEDGSESFNLFDHNLSIQCPAFGTLNTHDRGTAGTGFWFRGQNNYMRNNVAADHAASGYSINAYRLGNENTTIPESQGSHDRKPININTLPILEFDNNESYGPAFFALDLWEIGSTGETLYDVATSTIKDFTAWHVRNEAIGFYRSHRILIDGLVIRGDASLLSSRFNNPVGVGLVSTYRVRNYTIRNADIQGVRTGIVVGLRVTPDDTPLGSRFGLPAPQDRPGIILIEDSHLQNYFNLSVQTRKRGGSPRQTQIRNVTFDQLNMPAVSRLGPQRSIAMNYRFGLDNDAIASDQVFIEDYQGIEGNDFQLFYPQQSPSFIVPQTTNNGRTIGSPVAGLSNEQNWETYGIAIAGELAPCLDDSIFPEILGFACGTFASPPPSVTDTESPSLPTGLVAVTITEDRVHLSWNPSTDNIAVTAYVVLNHGTEIGTTSTPAFVHRNLSPGTHLNYTIIALDAANNASHPSAPLTVNTALPVATSGMLNLVARDQFNHEVLGAKIRRGSTLYGAGTEIEVEWRVPYTFRAEHHGILGPWITFVFEAGQSEIPPLFHTVSSSARDQLNSPVPDGVLRVSNIPNPIPSQAQDIMTLPAGASVMIRAERLGNRGPWRAVTFNSSLAQIGHRFQTLSSSAIDQFDRPVDNANIRISNHSSLLDASPLANLTLPEGATINVRGERHGIRGKWYSRTITPTTGSLGSLFWTISSSALDQHQRRVDGKIRVFSFTGPVLTGLQSTLTLPKGATPNIRAEVQSVRGPWRKVTLAEGLDHFGSLFWTCSATARDQYGTIVGDAVLRISGLSTPINPNDDAQVSLPLGARTNVRPELHGIRGAWSSYHFEPGLETIGHQFQTLDTVMTNFENGEFLDGEIFIANHQISPLTSGTEVTLPHGSTISTRARFSGRNGAWTSHSITPQSALLLVVW